MRSVNDPKKKTASSSSSSPYREILLSSVDKSKSSNIPPEMLDQMQAIIDGGNIMDKRDDLKKYLNVLVEDYGLDTSKLADGVADQKAIEKDLGYFGRTAERAKIGAGLTALGYARGGMLDSRQGDPTKKPSSDSTNVSTSKPYVHPIYGFTIPEGEDLPYDDDAPAGTGGQTVGGMAMRPIKSTPAVKQDVSGVAGRIQRQMMAESSGNPEAVSDAGARGLFQIMPATQKDLEDRGLIPEGLDPFNPKHSRQMRDAKINALSDLSWIKNPPQPISEKNRLARIYASYNAGEGRVKSALEKAKADGVDIYGDPEAWYKYLPSETQDYLPKILD